MSVSLSCSLNTGKEESTGAGRRNRLETGSYDPNSRPSMNLAKGSVQRSTSFRLEAKG